MKPPEVHPKLTIHEGRAFFTNGERTNGQLLVYAFLGSRELGFSVRRTIKSPHALSANATPRTSTAAEEKSPLKVSVKCHIVLAAIKVT